MENSLNENLKIQDEKSELLEILYKTEAKIDYVINENTLKLIHKITNENFKFTNQSEYDIVFKYVESYVKFYLLEKLKMKCIWLPSSNVSTRNYSKLFTRTNKFPQCELYITNDFFDNQDKLLCLIQGTGKVKAGMWSGSVCINESIEHGSVIPYVEQAVSMGMSVIVFNPNQRLDPITGQKISEFSSMEKHCRWVYENVVKKFSKAKQIYIVAHSMGGYCTIDILLHNSDDINGDLINKIAFTDSVHGSRPKLLGNETYKNLVKKSINFVTSRERSGEYLSPPEKNYDMVYHFSAGHHKHEFTSGYAKEEIFKFFFDDGK